MKSQRKKFAVILIFLLFAVNCTAAFSPRQQCIDIKCKNAFVNCYLTMSLFYSMLYSSSTYSTGSTSTSSSPTDYSSSEIYTTSSYNDTFNGAEYMSLPSSSYNYIYSGSMSSGTDIDIYYASPYSSYKYKYSQTNGSATCYLYSESGYTYNNTATPLSSYTLLGTLSTTAIEVTGATYIYVKCSGSSGSSYKIKGEYVATSSSTTGSSSNTGSSSTSFYTTMFPFISCASAESECIATCSKKHSY